MFVVFGSRLCGRVDDVPDILYVKSKFLHLNYLPLLPTSSYVILEGSEKSGGFHGVQIPMSVKSVFAAWLRTAFLFSAAMGSIIAVVGLSDRQKDAAFILTGLTVAAASVGLYWLSRKLLRASMRRAVQLAEHLGLDEKAIHAAFETRRNQPRLDERDSHQDDVFRLE